MAVPTPGKLLEILRDTWGGGGVSNAKIFKGKFGTRSRVETRQTAKGVGL